MIDTHKKSRLAMLALLGCLFMGQCTYLHYSRQQADYRKKFKKNHLRADSKHLIETDTYFIVGHLKNWQPDTDQSPMAIAAIDRQNPDDLVDVTHQVKADSFFGLHLPEGHYDLLVLKDSNGDSIYEEREIEASKKIEVNAVNFPTFIGEFSVTQTEKVDTHITLPQRIPVVASANEETPSLFYPKGSIKSLENPLFAKKRATMGMYAPATFMELAPMLFYAMEEDLPFKTPIIFVHGIGGSPVEFQHIIDKLDRGRYKPWFFYYPSGSDLDKSARLFYKIFLSGKVIPNKTLTPTIIVAHSMGGLVVRQAFNYYKNISSENRIDLFVSISSPFQGHPKAAKGIRKAPMVIPSWRDLDPNGAFIAQLFQKPLPTFLKHYLVYTSLPNTSKNAMTDGVVPTASQQFEPAIAQARKIHHFSASHTDILTHDPFITLLFQWFVEQKSKIPEGHFPYLIAGGFQVTLSSDYTPLEVFSIRKFGHFLNALDQGRLQPALDQEHHFLDVTRGNAPPKTYVETAWLKFKKDHPEILKRPFKE